MRTFADILDSHPRNDVEALYLIVVGWFVIALPFDVGNVWIFHWAFAVWAGYTFYRWHLRDQSTQAWPPPAESMADWPGK